MIEIKYEYGIQRIIHDGKNYSLENLMGHLGNNGHKREIVGFAVPPEYYSLCNEIARKVEELFNKK